MSLLQENASAVLKSFPDLAFVLTALINRRKPHSVLKQCILLSFMKVKVHKSFNIRYDV